MTEYLFYHLTVTALDQALPKLLEKALQGGFRVHLCVATEEEAERINGLLWTYNPDSFLPHGTAKDGYGDQQPVYIGTGEDAPNRPSLIVVVDGRRVKPSESVQRVLDVFNGASDEEVAKARDRWKQYTAEGQKLSYFRQTTSGGWEKQK